MSDHTLGEYRTTEFKENRRLAKVRITPDFLLGLCKAREPKRIRVALNALPDDVKATGAQYDALIGAWELAVTSESFAEVEHAVMLPILDAPTWEFVTESEELAALRRQVAALRAVLEAVSNEADEWDDHDGRLAHVAYPTILDARRVLAATQSQEVQS